MARKSVFLIREGGVAAQGGYDSWIGSMRRLFEESVTVRISSLEEAVTAITGSTGPGTQDSAVIFFTRDMFPKAEALQKRYPDLRVALLTGDSREAAVDHSGVLVIDKGAIDRDAVGTAVLA